MNCIDDGGFWFADGDTKAPDASFHCCDPRVLKDFMESDACIWRNGALWYSDSDSDDRIGIRVNKESPNWNTNQMPLIIGCEDEAAEAIVTANLCVSP